MSFKLNFCLLLLGAVYIQGKDQNDEAGQPQNNYYNTDEGDLVGPRMWTPWNGKGNGNIHMVAGQHNENDEAGQPKNNYYNTDEGDLVGPRMWTPWNANGDGNIHMVAGQHNEKDEAGQLKDYERDDIRRKRFRHWRFGGDGKKRFVKQVILPCMSSGNHKPRNCRGDAWTFGQDCSYRYIVPTNKVGVLV